MAKIIGRFYLEIDGNNLKGEFSNNLHVTNYQEYAVRTSEGEGFIGSFNSSWTDETGSFEGILKIELKNQSLIIYSLTWISNSIIFMARDL